MSALRPSRILVHPVWWAALALLLFNDHLFKGSGLLPADITGKLSDFVGLLVAPAILAVLCQVRTARGFARSHLAIALGFAAINLSPALAAFVETTTAATPFPWVITVDPSDLIALPMVALSYALFLPWSAAPAPVSRILGRTGFGLGMLACVATSPPPGPEPGPIGTQPPQEPQLIFPTESAALMLANETGVDQRIRIRRLDSQVRIDCNTVAADPSRWTQRDWFGPAELWSLEPGRALPLVAQSGCSIYLIDGNELPMRLVFFTRGNQELSTDANAVADHLRLSIRMPAGTAEWGAHSELYPAPNRFPEEVEPLCQTIPDGFGLEWSAIPVGERLLVDIKTAPDDCTALDFESPDERSAPVRWFICAPVDLPFAADETLTISQLSMGANGALEGVRIDGPNGRVLLSRGQTVPALDLVSVNVLDSSCAPSLGCGLEVPVQVQLNHVEGPPSTPAIGQAIPLAGGELTIVRAQRSLVVDNRCANESRNVNRVIIESVFVELF